MAQGNFEPCFKFTLGEEGKYSNTRRDPGNWSSGRVGEGRFIGTCWGISAPVLLAWVGPNKAPSITSQDMKNLPIATAKAIYQRNYWALVRGDELPAGLDLAVWDFGVNAGVERSIEMFQDSMGVESDGDFGPETMAAIDKFQLSALISNLIDWHDWFYRQDPYFSEFGEEWLGRQQRLREASLAMMSA